MSKNEIYIINDNNAFLPGSGTAVTTFREGEADTGFLEDRKFTAKRIAPATGSCTRGEVEFVPFGPDDDTPLKVMERIHKNTIVGSNIDFKVNMAFGDGLAVYRRERDEQGETRLVEQLPKDQPDVFRFLERSNYDRLMQEVANDLVVFGDSFVRLVMSRGTNGGEPAIAMALHREMCFSRVSKQDEQSRRIAYHGYSSKWSEMPSPDDVIVTPLLERANPLYDLLVRLGKEIDPESGERRADKQSGYVLSLNLPCPGRFYYNRPYWWSIFLDWYEFSCAIPRFKKALLKNQMVLKYHVSINERFWEKLYASENVTKEDKKKREELKRKFLQNLNDFLSGEENAGKSFVSHFRYDQVNKYEESDIQIKPIESFIKGGEYIEDSEEATNMICNTMAVHPSLKGASPGKSKNINGTEARELFIIAQALFKPIRSLMVQPLYIAKAVNGWPEELEFAVKSVMLTTLDKGTGSVKSIGNEEI